jgi:magnesium transporter
MANGKIRRSKKFGLPPGTLMYIGNVKDYGVKITVFDYSETHYQERILKDVNECTSYKEKTTPTWINFDGIHKVELIQKVGDIFNLHPLLLEDIVNTEHRPKLEDYGDYIFFTLKMLNYDNDKDVISTEQISFVLGKNYVLSFQENEGDIFDSIRDRIRTGKGRVRKKDTDYLVFVLADAIVDRYYYIVESLGEKIEKLEEEIIANHSDSAIKKIQRIKKDLILLRRSIYPLREAIGTLEKGESVLIEKSTRKYFKDVYDHTIQVIEYLEAYRDMTATLMELYLSGINNKMNTVMKVLTIIATIFIPLTFIAGIYGMNFDNMPELRTKYGYFVVLAIMFVIGLGMMYYFRKKKWL